jgi:hypothetical protein
MTFDNTKTNNQYQDKTVHCHCPDPQYLAVVYLIKLIKFPVLGLGDVAWTIILISIYLIVFFIPVILNYQFVSYSDDDDNKLS